MGLIAEQSDGVGFWVEADLWEQGLRVEVEAATGFGFRDESISIQRTTPACSNLWRSCGSQYGSGCRHFSSHMGRGRIGIPLSRRTSKAKFALNNLVDTKSPLAPMRSTAVSASLSGRKLLLAQLPNKAAPQTEHAAATRFKKNSGTVSRVPGFKRMIGK